MSQLGQHPWARVTIRGDGASEVVLDGAAEALHSPTLDQARADVVSYLASRAEQMGRSIAVEVDEPDGTFQVLVNPDSSLGEVANPVLYDAAGDGTATSGASTPAGTSEAHTDEQPAVSPGPAGQTAPLAGLSPSPPGQTLPPLGASSQPAPVIHPARSVPTPQTPPEPESSPSSAGLQAQPVASPPASDQVADWMRGQQGATPPVSRRQLRESFLHVEQPEPAATTGVRGVLARVGIKMEPTPAEREERDDIYAVSQHWPGVRTVAVVNGKGGAGKSPTTALLAATFARYSGAATVAWDNNETRGTLGWRTEQSQHAATVLDLIPHTGELMDPSARAGDISHYVHHQAADKYDVLRSNPNLLAAEQRIGSDDVDAIHDVLGRYYRLIFVDSGNDESAENWLRMIDKADQLVVPTIARPEHAEAGALLLEALNSRGGRSAQLAQRAIVIVSQARERDANPSAAEIASGFTAWMPAAVTIPYDPAMVENVLRFDALAPKTRRAWLRAAAAVARQL